MTLDELVHQVVDDQVTLNSVLLKAKVLAYNLHADNLKSWLEGEINGYTGNMSIPEYRRNVSTWTIGTLVYETAVTITNHAIPSSLLSENLRNFSERITIDLSVATIEGFIKNDDGHVQAPWPSGMVAVLSHELMRKGEYGGYLDARRQVGRASLQAILDNTRNRLLTFLMELQEQYPDLDISKRSDDLGTSQTAQTLVNNYIYGDNNTVGSGHDFTQNVTHTINSLDALLAHLGNLGVEQEDREMLEQAIVADQQSGRHRIGDNVKAWLGNFTAGASSHVATNLPQIVTAISTFLGQ